MLRCGLELGNRILEALICSFRCLFMNLFIHRVPGGMRDAKGSKIQSVSAGASSAEKPDLSFFPVHFSFCCQRTCPETQIQSHHVLAKTLQGLPVHLGHGKHKLVRTGYSCVTSPPARSLGHPSSPPLPSYPHLCHPPCLSIPTDSEWSTLFNQSYSCQ